MQAGAGRQGQADRKAVAGRQVDLFRQTGQQSGRGRQQKQEEARRFRQTEAGKGR